MYANVVAALKIMVMLSSATAGQKLVFVVYVDEIRMRPFINWKFIIRCIMNFPKKRKKAAEYTGFTKLNLWKMTERTSISLLSEGDKFDFYNIMIYTLCGLCASDVVCVLSRQI